MVALIPRNLFNLLAMTKQNISTWILLLVLTIIAGLVSSTSLTYVIPLILLLAVLKFIGVAFNFMEMKKAHVFWKVLLIGYLVVFCGIVLAINS